MKKAYVKPVLKASMNGTLEGVYACPSPDTNSRKDNNCWDPCNNPCYNPCQPSYGYGASFTICW